MSIVLQHPGEFYISGRWVEPSPGAQLHSVADAGTGACAATIRFGTADDVDAAVAAAHAAFPAWSQAPLADRIALLDRICAIYERRMDDVAQAITAEMGAPLDGLSRAVQAPAGLWHFQTAAQIARSFPFEHALPSGTRILREPVGVVAMITPWNWPMNQVVIKVAPALAVGCTMVLKPSQYAPLSAHILAEIIEEAGAPPGVFNLIHGSGAALGERLASHPDVDMVSLTGSNGAGASVARAAADSAKRVSLELGGKSANIVLDGAGFAAAVEQGVRTLMSNTGQSCNAPSRMLVPHVRLAEAEEIAARIADGLTAGDPRRSVDLGPVANERQFRRVQELIARGLEEGARLVAGGPGVPSGEAAHVAKPTVFSDVTNDMTIAREEIFGPVLCIISYRNEDDAVAIANDTIFGLSGYVGGGSREDAVRVARRLRTGMVHVDGAPVDFTAPFGGYKQSGNGREWGAWGFEDFLETKAVMLPAAETSA